MTSERRRISAALEILGDRSTHYEAHNGDRVMATGLSVIDNMPYPVWERGMRHFSPKCLTEVIDVLRWNSLHRDSEIAFEVYDDDT